MAMVLEAQHNLLVDASHTLYPSELRVLQNFTFETEDENSYYFGYVLSSTCEIESEGLTSNLKEGLYFGLNSGFKMKTPGATVLIKRVGYRGLNTIGGPLEKIGRLLYIDGCTSTLLIAPARLGDCCLNLLYFPPETVQSRHTHPTIRLGVVTGGYGFCHTNSLKIELTKGHCFYLEENEEHYFSSGPDGLTVVAYHPDTDWGPTDEIHPMLNRTYIKT